MPLPPTTVCATVDEFLQYMATLLMVPLIVDKDSDRCFCLHKKRLRTQQ